MRCLGCTNRYPARDLSIFRKILLCPVCRPLAESALAKVEASIADAHKQALMLLDQHILNGGLIAAAKTPPPDPTRLREGSPSSETTNKE